MNPGMVEEVGKVATNTIESLKSQPVVLALVVFQVFTLGAVLYSSLNRQNAINKQFDNLYAILDKCLAARLSLQEPQPQLQRRASPSYRLQSDDDKPADLDHEYIGPPKP